MSPISFSAPGRAGILGNPSDIYGGSVISISVPARNRCTIQPSVEDELPSDPTLWNAAISRFPLPGNWKVSWESEVPRSSGLAGSTALLAAIIACIFEAIGKDRGDECEFAELVRDIELNEAGVVCGYQDAYMVVHGGLRHIDFDGKHPIAGGPLGKVKTALIDREFLLVTTGVERLSGSVHGPMRERWLAGESKVVEAMVELRNLAMEASRGLDEKNLIAAMKRNFRIIQELGGSGPDIDGLVIDAENNGAKAAKLAGAGMGGTVICLCDDPEYLQQRLQKLGYQKFIRPTVTEGLRREK